MSIYKENAQVGGPGTFQNNNSGELQKHSTPENPDKLKTLKPFSMIRKVYLPPGIYNLDCIGWEVRPASQGWREKLAFLFKTNGTRFDGVTTARYYNIYRDENDIQHFPSRSDYTLEIGRLWPSKDDILPNDLKGKTVRCEVTEQKKDRRGKEIKNGIRPTFITEIIGWPE